MKSALARIAFVTCMVLGLLSPVDAYAAPPPIWSVSEVTSSGYVGTAGATLQVACPAGQTPLSGGYRSTTLTDIRRTGEQYGYGDGAKYVVDLYADSGYHQVTATVLCAPVAYFSGEHLVAQGFTTNASFIAAGTLGCPAGEKALNVSVTFNSTATTVLTTFPNAGLGSWFVRGWAQPAGATMTLYTRCVSGAGLDSIRMATVAPAVGWGTDVVAPCPGGMRPVTGGTYQSGGDGGAITVQGRPTATQGSMVVNNHTHYWPEGAWRSTALSTSGGYMFSSVACVPSTDPFIEGHSGPSPDPDSTSARWDFQVVDPAAPGGFTTNVWCAFAGPGQQPQITNPCASPFLVDGLADGSYNMTIHADTSDGRWAASNVGSVVIDTTPPVVGLQDVVFATSSPTVTLDILDATRVSLLSCDLDGTPVDPCGDGFVPEFCDELICYPSYYDYRYEQTLPFSGLPDGIHHLHAEAADERGNSAVFDVPFKVDTTAPSVTQSGPSARFTLATKATMTWTGTDAVSGISAYGVRWRKSPYNADFGAWSAPVVAAASATSRVFTGLQRGATYCFGIDATDHAGNTSAWTAGRCTAIPLDDRDLAESGGWHEVSAAGWFRGTALTTKTLGATLAVTGATVKRVAVVAKTCPTCGTVGAYVAGKLVGKVSLVSKDPARKLIALPAFALASGTVKLKVLTSGKLVQIDALGLTRL